MIKKVLVFSLFIFCLSRANAQKGGEINGYIHTEDNQAVAGAIIQIKELKLERSSDKNGRFSFNLMPGSYTIFAIHMGYHTESYKISVKAGETAQLDINCKHQPIQLDAVTVTAEKRENLLQKVPMAVSALSGKQIQERNIREMGDLVLAVPNLMSMNIGSPSLNIMSIRGVLTFSQDPVVGVYIDGVPMFDGYSASVQMQDIERVEVLRGPQSTLYGRNGLGGVINLITRKPDNNFHGFAEAGIGNYNAQRYNIGLSGPLIKDKLFAGISGLYDTRKGYFHNQYDGRKFDRPETYNGNFYLKYLASDKLSFTFNAKVEHNDVPGAFPYVPGAEKALKNPYVINQNGTNLEKRKLVTSSLQALYRTNGIELSSVTGYTYLSDTYKDYDIDYDTYNAMSFEVPRAPQNTLTQEFKIVTDSRKALKFTGGIFGFIDRKEGNTIYLTGPDMPPSKDPNAPLPPYDSATDTDRKIYGIAAYTNLSYALSSQWELTAGLRYDYEKRNMSYIQGFFKAPNPWMYQPEAKIKGHNGAFSPKLSISYNPETDLLLYATYSRGYRSGGFNAYTLDASRLNYKPEYTNNYEIGFKSEWLDKRLRANVALFYTRWKDQQQTLTVPENLIDNIGELTNKGGELELTALPVKGLEVNYNIGVVHTRYEKLLLPVSKTENKDFVGNKQIFTPSFTSSLSATYRYYANDQTSFYVIPEWKYFGKQYMTYYNDLTQNAFSLINISAGIKYRKFELSLWAKNIGEAKYLSFAYATQTAATTPVLIGNPRTYGSSLKVRF
ncbi:TonB-dependent receptor [Pedobacter caeni]|uniref:Iron complex outermembrane recepter protein n=1 Tax=Pedobacter caeni TaxID=288992 RepID=A0A1M4ZFI1_9SPHI|nr:TonB-dependent receptor [Pedobacter caeni]SHF16770.1 iron complex outermembrane recepter protein [Pedobacter caeni]